MIAQQHAPAAEGSRVFVRRLRESDLPPADDIFRRAFGTFLGIPDLFGDTDYIRTRWLAAPEAVLGAELDGTLVGSNFATRWGSVGFFGPLSVRADLWDRGIAKRLLEPTMELFARWGTTHEGLFTFGHSPKHVALYQKFDFWPRFLTAIMSKPARQPHAAPRWTEYSALGTNDREHSLRACAELTGAIYEGLDVEREIRAVESQRLGETVLLADNSKLIGFAVCHVGAGTEAGSGACYVKFGAARPGPHAGAAFERLLEACEALAVARGATRLAAGVNMARHEAYRALIARGFHADMQGVAMERGNKPGYNRPGVYLIDDWR